MSRALGRHILVEFFGCSEYILNDVNQIEEIMLKAAEAAEATIINSTFHHFSPYGVSGVVVIQESHLAIHAWPEFRYAAVDIFTCGETIDPWVAYDFLKEAFKAQQGSAMEINRGQIDLLDRIDFHGISSHREQVEDQVKPQYKREIWFTERDENIALSIRHKGKLLYNESSPYQEIKVYDTFAYGKMLTIDGAIMCTEKDEYGYHEMLVHIPMLTHPAPKKVLVIGGGDGGTIREILRHPQLEKVTMVEIDKQVIEASKRFLPTLSSAFEHPKLELVIGDGIQYINNTPPESFDIILVDGNDQEGPSEGLFTQAFYEQIHKCLKPEGIFCTHSESPYFFKEMFIFITHCHQAIYGKENVHNFLAYIPTYPTGMWSFIYANKGEIHPIKNLDDIKSNTFSKQQNLQYYSAEMHRSAFALPPFVRHMLSTPNS